MATLKERQKQALYQALVTLFESGTLEENKEYTGKEIKDLLDRPYKNYSTTSIVNILIHYLPQDLITILPHDRKSNTYIYTKIDSNLIYRIIDNTSFTKDKNILSIPCENDKVLKYDFNKKSFLLNDNERVVDNNNSQSLYNILKHDYTKEWIFSYPELLCSHDYIPCIDFDPPKGYVNYLKETNGYINKKTMNEFKIASKINNARIAQNLLKRCGLHRTEILIENVDIKDIQKIIVNQVKELDLCNLSGTMNNLIDTIEQLVNIKQEFTLDTNRGLSYNYQELENLYNMNRHKRLHDNLHKLNFLNGIEIDKYKIIVPQTIADLQEEGRKQNNCVGHYYNSSIDRGENLIYFLRDKENPSKSVVTCRYNIREKLTIEHRVKNNRDTTRKQNEIIKAIDKIIKENLIF